MTQPNTLQSSLVPVSERPVRSVNTEQETGENRGQWVHKTQIKNTERVGYNFTFHFFHFNLKYAHQYQEYK